MLVSVAPAEVIFSGFQSKAFWLVFGGLIIGIALKKSGLGVFVAARITARFNTSYMAAVTGVVIMGTVLAFVMPSTMGRVLLILPITLAITEQLGFDKTSRGYAGLVLAAGVGTYLPGAGLLPATVPGMVLVGAAETQHGIVFTYTDWFWRHFPIFGLLKLPLMIAVTTYLFADQPKPLNPAPNSAQDPARPLSPDAKLLAVLLLIALALWATDGIHGISPAWVSLAFGVICLLPQTGLVSSKVFAESFQLGPADLCRHHSGPRRLGRSFRLRRAGRSGGVGNHAVDTGGTPAKLCLTFRIEHHRRHRHQLSRFGSGDDTACPLAGRCDGLDDRNRSTHPGYCLCRAAAPLSDSTGIGGGDHGRCPFDDGHPLFIYSVGFGHVDPGAATFCMVAADRGGVRAIFQC